MIIPTPHSVKYTGGCLDLSGGLYTSTGIPSLSKAFHKYFPEHGSNAVFVEFLLYNPSIGEEGYVIDVNSEKITVSGDTEKGLFYGLQSVVQMFDYAAKRNFMLDCCSVKDFPEFGYRGFMLDCSRHFFDTDVVKKILDACALLKINVFHWHLTDDQGWRFESDKYPLLTEKGSERACTRGDGKPVKGYYTKAQMKEIVAYAADNFIEVIPEFDMPGHSVAAIACYPELSCADERTEVKTRFGIDPLIMCAGKESSYEFARAVLGEAAGIFTSDKVHIGGDEAPKARWKDCPRCAEVMKKMNLENFEQLQAVFTNKIINILKEFGKTAIVWNDSMQYADIDKSAVMQYWRAKEGEKKIAQMINGGRKTIVSKFTPCYLDYPYGMHPMKALYSFSPVLKGVTDSGKANVLGMEVPLWTEYVADKKKLHFMAFPRLVAAADVAWAHGRNRKYRAFLRNLENLYDRLGSLGIEPAPLSEAKKGRLTGWPDVIKFFANAYDKQSAAEFVAAQKESKTK